jgi:hypothetical protein
MKNSLELRDELIAVFRAVKAKKMATGAAKEMTNAAGKIIGTVKLELEYAALRKERPNIPFLSHATSSVGARA